MRLRVLASVLWFLAAWAVANGIAVHADLPRDPMVIAGVLASAAAWLAVGRVDRARRSPDPRRRKGTAAA